MPAKLTAKQARFVKEYLVDGNATQAAIRAKYSKKTAEQIGYQLLQNSSVRRAVADGQAKQAQKLEITADQIAAELVKLGFSNMADYMDVDPRTGQPSLNWAKLSRDQAAALTEVSTEQGKVGVKVRFRLADKRSALVDLAKLLGFWKERSEVNLTFDHAAYLAKLVEAGK